MPAAADSFVAKLARQRARKQPLDFSLLCAAHWHPGGGQELLDLALVEPLKPVLLRLLLLLLLAATAIEATTETVEAPHCMWWWNESGDGWREAV